MKVGHLLLTLFVLAASQTANASSGDAIKSFGLTGHWSNDCLLDPQKGGGRMTVDVPFLESPSIISITSFKKGEVWIVRTTKWDVMEATAITEDKLKITHTVIYSDSSAPSAPPIKFDDRFTVFLKTGNKIRIIAAQSVDGTKIFVSNGHIYTARPPNFDQMVDSGSEQPALERCLN